MSHVQISSLANQYLTSTSLEWICGFWFFTEHIEEIAPGKMKYYQTNYLFTILTYHILPISTALQTLIRFSIWARGSPLLQNSRWKQRRWAFIISFPLTWEQSGSAISNLLSDPDTVIQLHSSYITCPPNPNVKWEIICGQSPPPPLQQQLFTVQLTFAYIVFCAFLPLTMLSKIQKLWSLNLMQRTQTVGQRGGQALQCVLGLTSSISLIVGGGGTTLKKGIKVSVSGFSSHLTAVQ